MHLTKCLRVMAEKVGNVVIAGGGIIGCSIAYHLTELGANNVTVVEKCSVACGASGKAGGFLARTWCDGGPVGVLARESFDLHKKYGAMFACDYRALDSLEIYADERSDKKKSSTTLDWLDKRSVTNASTLGDTTDTAQVHPWKLSHCFLEAAKKKGCKLIIGEVTGVEFSPHDKKSVTAVQVKDKPSLPCDILILALGPWTNTASQWFQYHLPVITYERTHSIVMKPSRSISAHALFLSYKSSTGKTEDPEIYPRPDGTVYMCGISDREKLPDNADLVNPNKKSVSRLHEMAGNISSALQESEVITEQACYLPIPPGNVPVIGRVPGYNHHVYVAAGHYCWGILNAPATGKCLAELIVNGHSSIDLSPFDPANFI